MCLTANQSVVLTVTRTVPVFSLNNLLRTLSLTSYDLHPPYHKLFKTPQLLRGTALGSRCSELKLLFSCCFGFGHTWCSGLSSFCPKESLPGDGGLRRSFGMRGNEPRSATGKTSSLTATLSLQSQKPLSLIGHRACFYLPTLPSSLRSHLPSVFNLLRGLGTCCSHSLESYFLYHHFPQVSFSYSSGSS